MAAVTFAVVVEIAAGELEGGEQGVDVDPAGVAVVIGQVELVLLARHGEPFDELGLAVDAGEAAAAVFETAGHDFEGEAGAG